MIDPLASNTRAHTFYERVGFQLVGPRTFGEDDCLVYRLDRYAWLRTFILGVGRIRSLSSSLRR